MEATFFNFLEIEAIVFGASFMDYQE
jgi:hypothetical protein